jgi:hypothetical protein
MGFAEYARGMTSQEIQYLKERERSQQLREQHSRWEDYFMILRPTGDKLPPMEERFKLWKDLH